MAWKFRTRKSYFFNGIFFNIDQGGPKVGVYIGRIEYKNHYFKTFILFIMFPLFSLCSFPTQNLRVKSLKSKWMSNDTKQRIVRIFGGPLKSSFHFFFFLNNWWGLPWVHQRPRKSYFPDHVTIFFVQHRRLKFIYRG